MSTETRRHRRMRSREEIAYMHDWLSKEQRHRYSGPAYQRGALELLRWTLGRQAAGPVTGRVVERVSQADVNSEGFEAQTAIYNGGRAAVGELPNQFLLGVEAYSIWLTGGDSLALPEEWPFPGEAPPTTPDGYAAVTDTRQSR